MILNYSISSFNINTGKREAIIFEVAINLTALPKNFSLSKCKIFLLLQHIH